MSKDFVIAFKRCGFVLGEEGLQNRVQSLADALRVSAEWTAKYYEVFMSSREFSREVTEDLVDMFEDFAKQQHKKEASNSTKELLPSASYLEDTTAVLTDNTNRLQGQALRQQTPAKQVVKPVAREQRIAPTTAFHQRTQKGVVVSSLNEHLSFPAPGEAMEVDEVPTCTVQEMGQGMDFSQLFMMDRLQDKVEYLEERILAFAGAVEAAEGCSVANPVNIAVQEQCMMVGRICCDSEGRLNENSILLEGSIRHSQGNSVKLDVSKLDAFRLFPGQVVAVEGTNPSGHCIIASRLITLLPKPMPTSPPTQLASVGASGMAMIIASGPFSLSDAMDYQPLQEIVQVCEAQKPDLVILLGPFVAAEHALVQNGSLDQSFEDVFLEQVLSPLEALATKLSGKTQIALVPSTQDVHHLPVFPQPAFDVPAPRGVTLLSNPATFCCNEVVIGVVTSDVLKHMSGHEVQRGPQALDRIAGIASHLLGQRSYYPLFPPTVGTMLDTSLARHLQLPCSPDLLILPSDLKAFAKMVPAAPGQSPSAPLQDAVEGTVVCINPGRLTKGSTGGTFALVQIGPTKEALSYMQGQPAATNAPGLHRVSERCKVEIRKI